MYKIDSYVSNYQTNCYVLYDEEEAIVIDPCIDYQFLKKRIDNLPITKVLITHGHFDHINKLDTFFNKGISFYMDRRCLEKIADSEKNLSTMTDHPFQFDMNDEIVCLISDGQVIKTLGLELKVIQTFGHTNCSITYIIGNDMFTGDFLFKGTIGRCDLYSANTYDMMESLKKIRKYRTNYHIYPGHGSDTFLFNEFSDNNYLKKI